MNPLMTVALFWGVVLLASLLFGLACIRYGVYTSGSNGNRPSIEI